MKTTQDQPAKQEKTLSRAEKLENTRQAILTSALTLFSRFGYEGASVRAIAEDAGVAHGMIRHIYQTKEELWRKTIAYLFERMDRELPSQFSKPLQEDTDLRKLFLDFNRWYIGYCSRYPEHARLMIQQSMLEGPHTDWIAESYVRERHARHMPVLEEMRNRGLLPDADPFHILLILVSASQMPFLIAQEIKAISGKDFHTEEEIERYAQSLTDIFIRPQLQER